MYLPNFLTIGAMKSGTTSLHEYLSRHPEIYMSTKKEIDFFCHEKKYKRGLNWYKVYFPVNAKVRGESSQNYSKYHWWKNVPKRILSNLGAETKFIYILRDPLERVYSHYHEMQEQNCAPTSLEDYILKDLSENEIVLTSCYHKQLNHFLEYFPLKNFKIITLEKLQRERLEVMNEVFHFLGVEELKDDDLFSFTKNSSKEKKARSEIAHIISTNPILIKAKKLVPAELTEALRTSQVYKKLAFKKIDLSTRMSEKTESKLKQIFKQDTDELRKLTGMKLEDWCI